MGDFIRNYEAGLALWDQDLARETERRHAGCLLTLFIVRSYMQWGIYCEENGINPRMTLGEILDHAGIAVKNIIENGEWGRQ